ncbi:MAG: DEAD/DEAH box helicase [Patescibacteria group bacterium]|nr:DEAD/DEAH box helicase [Patescibacteria group bacterium]
MSLVDEAKQIGPNKIAVPCTIENMQLMRVLGYEAYSPILFDYDWPGRFKPFDHQYHISAFLTLHPRAFNLSDIGTGKTLSTLWAADYLMSKGIIHKAVVLSPLSTLHRVWLDEVFTHFLSKRRAVVLHGSREKRLRLLREDADFYIINHDGLGVGSVRGPRGIELGDLAASIRDNECIDALIVDEGSIYKDSNTLRYKILRQVAKNKPYMWWLTGTPTPNSPVDAWAQAKLIRPEYDESYRAFQDRTMHRITQFKWVPKPESVKISASILQPAIRYHRDECLTLPPCVSVMRDVELTNAQKKALAALKTQLAAMVGTGNINAVNEAALRTKMLQVSLGAVYDSDHNTHKLDCSPRLQVMREIIEQTEEKILIFAPLTSVIELLYADLRKDYSVEKVNGEVSAGKRSEIFRAFQQEHEPRIIVADPRAMAHGLTLTAASTIIWYGPTDMPEVYTQANGRINRPGQSKSMLVVRLAGTNLEREIFKRLDNKESMQGAVLTTIKEGEVE